MNRIDDLLISRIFSPLSGWSEHELGMPKLRLALGCIDASIGSYFLGMALSLAHKRVEEGTLSYMMAAFGWLCIMTFARRMTLREAGSSLGVQTARMRESMLRLVLLVLLPFSLIAIRGPSNLCFTLSLIFTIAHLYFKAADTPPPVRRNKLAFHRG